MNIRNLLLLLLASVSPYMAIDAQSPGYVGSRFHVQAEFNFIPTHYGTTANNRGMGSYDNLLMGQDPFESQWRFSFDTNYGARLETVLSRKVAFVLGYNHMQTGMIMRAMLKRQSDWLPTEYNVFHRLSINTFSAGVKIFKPRRGNIAPIGFYTGYYLNASFIKGTVIDHSNSNIDGSNLSPANDFDYDKTTRAFSLGIEWGETYILYKRLTFSWGIRLNIPFQLWKMLIYKHEAGPSVTLNGLEETNDYMFAGRSSAKLGYSNLLLMHLGLGYIF